LNWPIWPSPRIIGASQPKPLIMIRLPADNGYNQGQAGSICHSLYFSLRSVFNCYQ